MQLTDVDASVGIVDDRVAMSADIETSLYLDTPDPQPLSAGETHATLTVGGDGVRVAIDLDAAALDALADAIHHAREPETGEEKSREDVVDEDGGQVGG